MKQEVPHLLVWKIYTREHGKQTDEPALVSRKWNTKAGWREEKVESEGHLKMLLLLRLLLSAQAILAPFMVGLGHPWIYGLTRYKAASYICIRLHSYLCVNKHWLRL